MASGAGPPAAPAPEVPVRPVRLPRRFAAIAYDACLLFGVLFVATALVLPFASGPAIAPGNRLYLLYLLGVSYLYFGWFWTHGGQTLGMRAWGIRMRATDAERVSWGHATRRFLASLLSWGALGAGFLWTALDAERRAWHDRLSATTLEPDPGKTR